MESVLVLRGPETAGTSIGIAGHLAQIGFATGKMQQPGKFARTCDGNSPRTPKPSELPKLAYFAADQPKSGETTVDLYSNHGYHPGPLEVGKSCLNQMFSIRHADCEPVHNTHSGHLISLRLRRQIL